MPPGVPSSPVPGPCQRGPLGAAPEGERPPWGLGQVGAGIAVALVASTAASLGWAIATGRALTAQGPLPLGLIVCGIVGIWIGLLGAVVYSARAAGRPVASEFGLAIKLWPDVPLGVAVGVSYQLIGLSMLYQPILYFDPGLRKSLSAPAQQLLTGAHGTVGTAVIGFLVAVGAPVVEELFFRGLVLRSLERRFARLAPRGGRWLAVVGSAMIFALVHGEPVQLLGLAVLGVFLGYVAQRTGRLGPSLVTHAAFNATALAVLAAFH